MLKQPHMFNGIFMILIIYAHPYPRHSHANQRLLDAVADVADLNVRSLYDLYPDFNINVAAEQQYARYASFWPAPCALISRIMPNPSPR